MTKILKMASIISLAFTIAATVAPVAWAQSATEAKPKPPDFNGLMVWPYQKLNATDGQERDASLIWMRSAWLSPELGVNTVMTSFAAGAVRLMSSYPLPGGGWAIGMAGLRFTNMGNSPLNLSPNFHLGPEVAAMVTRPLAGPWGLMAQGSYARVFASNAGTATDPFKGQATQLVFLGANLQYAFSATGALQMGVMDSFNVGDLQGLMFHNLGPTVTFIQRF